MYVYIADLRAEGVTELEASDERLDVLIDEASATIDRMTGWWFEPRARVLRLDGRGTPSIEPPVPPITIDRVAVGGRDISLDPEDIVVEGAPVRPGFAAPRLTLCHGRFPRGCGNVIIEGVWGYTEDDGSPHGRTPPEIRRACMLMVMTWLPALAGGDSDDARHAWRVTSMRTRDQAVTFAQPGPAGPFTGDPEIDRLLARYRRPMSLGAA